MRNIRYSSDVDVLLIELSEKKIDYAEEEGQMIIHLPKDGESVLLEILDAKNFILSSISSIFKEQEVAIPWKWGDPFPGYSHQKTKINRMHIKTYKKLISHARGFKEVELSYCLVNNYWGHYLYGYVF